MILAKDLVGGLTQYTHVRLHPDAGFPGRIVPSDPRDGTRIIAQNRLGIWRPAGDVRPDAVRAREYIGVLCADGCTNQVPRY